MRELQDDTDRIIEDLIFERRFSVKSTLREEWSTGRHPDTLDREIWYTDGSKLEGKTGSAAWEPVGEQSLIGSAGPDATVFQAEILAIKMCTDKLLHDEVGGRRIGICADSWATLSSLAA